VTTAPPLPVAFQVDQLWFSAPGGIGTYVWELSAALETLADVEVIEFHTRWDHDAPRHRLGAHIEVPWPSKMAFAGWSTVRRPKLPHDLDRASVVHATNPATIPPIRGPQRLVVTIHDLAFEDQPEAFPAMWLRMYRRGLSIARDEAAAVIVPSEYVADQVRGAGIDAARVHVTLLAGRPTQLPAPTLPPEAVVENLGIDAPYVLSVGTFEPRKNQARLVRAYRTAVEAAGLPHALVLAGHPGWRTDDLDKAIDEGGPGRVIRIESAGDQELDALYRAAALTAYVSLGEGFGMPVLEAMARRSPVVASSTTSIPEVAGDAAVLVDPTDEDAIAGALARVLTDETLADDLRRRGPERAATFTWAKTATDTLRIYTEALR
jgi:glycosyltransferase involved in cell wall biosynthesis